MKWGTSYYPEVTPADQWQQDLQAMRDAGLTVLRIADFAWSSIEPREGVYEFDWLDRFVDLATELGFQIVLCTPTAAPPPWLTTQYPQIMIVRRDGSRHYAGGRRDVDTDSDIFRHYAVEIAAALGRRYGRHPTIAGWQIDNELLGPEGEPPESHTAATTFRFRQYLKRVHGDIATLNRRWGMKFWSQEFSDWGEITTPLNPRSVIGQVLDYSRFFSQSQRDFLKLQYDALRGVISDRQWISHNSTAVFDRGLDHADWAQVLDVAGWDAYFGAAGQPHPEAFTGMAHDLFRGAKQKPFWAFETNPVNSNFTPAFVAEMRARGAMGVILWHWRCIPFNAENQSDTVCDYDGNPDPHRIERLRQLSSDQALNAPIAEASLALPAALLYAPDCVRVRLTPDPYMQRGQTKLLPYLRTMVETWKRSAEHGLAVDLVRPSQSLAERKLLILPDCRLLSDAFLASARAFVETGGVLVTIGHVGLQDEWGVFRSPMGGGLADVLGIAVSRPFDCRAATGPAVVLSDGQTVESLPLVQPFELRGAEAIAHFTDGQPAATRHRFGRGTSFHLASLCLPMLSQVLREATTLAGLPFHADRQENVFHLTTSIGQWVFNHSSDAITVAGRNLPAKDFSFAPASPRR